MDPSVSPMRMATERPRVEEFRCFGGKVDFSHIGNRMTTLKQYIGLDQIQRILKPERKS